MNTERYELMQRGQAQIEEFYKARTPAFGMDPGADDSPVVRYPISHIVGRCIPVRSEPMHGPFGSRETFYWVCPPDCPVEARGYE